MSASPRTYADLSAQEQAAFSVWIDTFEQSFPYAGAAALKEALAKAPYQLRVPLAAELLPSLMDHQRQHHNTTPTLHELRSRFPDLAGLLTAAYPLLPAGYQLPVQLRGYRILQVVGEGGQALVLRAQDDVHSAVAIKLSVSATHNEYVLRERRLLGQCQHAGIPEVIASGVVQERAYFIMPFLRGMTLADKYATHRATVEETVRLGTELCGIVAHLHALGIVHRDIKPENIWLDAAGTVKLIDLGMAIDRSAWGASRSSIGEFHGTPAFMSPEQAAADSETDGELSDVYSIGAVLYWMGTGKTDTLTSHFDDPSSASKRGFYKVKLPAIKGWPKRLRQVCASAVSAKPVDRPTAAILGATLDQLSHPAPRSRKRDAVLAGASLLAILAAYLSWPMKQTQLATPKPEAIFHERSVPHRVAKPVLPVSTEGPVLPPEEAKAEPQPSLKMSDFRIDLSSSPPTAPPWGHIGHDRPLKGELTVKLEADLPELAGVEYRVGNRKWTALVSSDDEKIFRSMLDPWEASSSRPVQVRLRKPQSDDADSYFGPFTFPLHIEKVIRGDRQRKMDQLITEARRKQVFENVEGRWIVPDEFSAEYSPVITDILCSTDDKEPLRSLLAKARRLRHKIPDEDLFSLQRCFARTGSGLRDATQLWVQLKFIDGSLHGPIRYSKPLSNEERRQRDVAAWKTRNGIKGELAAFKHDRFQLTGLQQVASQFTHLEAAGRYHQDAVTDSKSGSRPGRSQEVSANMMFEIDPAKLGEVFPASPVWYEILLRGHLTAGGMTPIFRIRNSSVACGTGIDPLKTTSNIPPIALYVFIKHDAQPSQMWGVTRFLSDPRSETQATLRECDRSRLQLMTFRAIGTAKAELFADKNFTKRINYAIPGLVYARYTDRQGRTVGSSVYEFSEDFIQEWADHAMSHVQVAEKSRRVNNARKSRQ